MMMMLKHWVLRIMIIILKTAKKLQSILSQKRLGALLMMAMEAKLKRVQCCCRG